MKPELEIQSPAVFVAAPFTALIDLSSGSVPETNPVRVKMSGICAALKAGGFHVFSAHEREDWGRNLFPPDRALRVDLEWLDRADALVAEIGDPPSPGVQFELGYFIARKKPILICSRTSEPLPYLAQGLRANAQVSFLPASSKEVSLLVLDWARAMLLK